MNPIFVMVVHVIADQPAKMCFVQRDEMVKDFAAATSYPAFRYAFCHGAWTLVRMGFRPVAFKNVMTSSSNFESRSRIT